MARKNVYHIDLSGVIRTQQGRGVVSNLVERLGYFSTPRTEFAAGMHAAAMMLMQDIERIAPEYAVMLMRERLESQIQPDREEDDNE